MGPLGIECLVPILFSVRSTRSFVPYLYIFKIVYINLEFLNILLGSYYPDWGDQIPRQDMITDLECRFLVNLPPTELASFDRIMYHLSEASWFFNDHLRHEYGREHLSTRDFCRMMFQESPVLRFARREFDRLYRSFCAYIRTVPVYGCIIQSECGTYVLLVRGPTGYWSFPKGKQNQGEDGMTCARREVHEETGYTCSPILGTPLVRYIYGRYLTMYRLHVPLFPINCPIQNVAEIVAIEWVALSLLVEQEQRGSRWYPTVLPFIAALF